MKIMEKLDRMCDLESQIKKTISLLDEETLNPDSIKESLEISDEWIRGYISALIDIKNGSGENLEV